MGKIKTFKDLFVWQKAHRLVLGIYKLTKSFPIEEKFGLISQMRRSSTSIPTNIAEGFKRSTTKDYLNFLNIADTSFEEVKYQIVLSHDLKYLSKLSYDEINNLCDEIGRMLGGLRKRLLEKK